MRDASVSWQKILAQGFASTDELLKYLDLPADPACAAAERQFRTRVPRGFAARMQPGDPCDPLLLQVLAVRAELQDVSGYESDPLQEGKANRVQGLIHKYPGRVLLTATGVCAINCRYCFRRHFPYHDNNPGREGWRVALDYIRDNPSIHEVILSGGDPLLASDRMLSELTAALSDIAHVRTIRFHTRIPVVLPERINSSFLALLRQIPLRKVVVIHCNHAREIDNSVRDVCLALVETGCHLLNQSVLLKGVNDDADVLAELSEALFDCRILPYYLHLLDKVAGAAHFDVPKERALAIYRRLQTLLPGYLVPKLAREEPGKHHKTLMI
ncbi:EF-P beta-lysylation protein EpmB [Legionella spiritensis]|uniref:EF-P beta-lysylation protein EpmB n=1 Tax=Legionella spiritensis TaxID=452 RepID=UPI000B94DFFA|nr:EF-P beta-lysylation protein EpmB [Legionella spiritensis]SNV29949.1 lysine 2,3-aminomutase [Legionella spiritensis]